MIDPATAFAEKPVLHGERVTLRPFVPEDDAPLRVAMRDPDVLRLTGSVHSSSDVPEISRERADEFRCWRNTRPDRLDLAILDEDGACVGEVVFNDYDPGNLSSNVRILIGPAGQNRGLGTDTLRTFLAHGFEKVGLHRVSLEVYTFNPRARRAYEKVGFRAEGVLRHSLRYDGEWIDACVMAILAPEWAEHRGRPWSERP